MAFNHAWCPILRQASGSQQTTRLRVVSTCLVVAAVCPQVQRFPQLHGQAQRSYEHSHIESAQQLRRLNPVQMHYSGTKTMTRMTTAMRLRCSARQVRTALPDLTLNRQQHPNPNGRFSKLGAPPEGSQ